MKRLFYLLLIIALINTDRAFAYDIVVENADGVKIYYNWINEQTELEVTYQREDAHHNAYNNNVVIPETVTYKDKTYFVTEIGENAFHDCDNLTSLNIPNSVKSIGSCAFDYCRGLTSLIIPNSVTSIGRSAFHGCESLISIIIPNSVTNIDFPVLGECSSLTTLIVEDGNAKYDSRNNCNAIIETASNTLKGGCKTTIIPNSVTSIGNSAFYYCKNLTSITIPNSITTIEHDAFSQCRSLTSIIIPNSVTSIGSGVFWGCSYLSSITIPSSVISINDDGGSYYEGAFSGTPWYNNQPDGVVYAGKVLYKYKGTMPTSTNIEIEEGIVSISPHAFYECSGLASVIIPSSVTNIGTHAFYKCSGLATLSIPSSVQIIGSHALQFCSSLTTIDIPNTVSEIGAYAFHSTPWFNSQPDGLLYAGSVAYHYKGTMPENTCISLANGTKGISGYAFNGCSGLTSVTIPSNVTNVGSFAFYGCSSLTSVTVGMKRPIKLLDKFTFSNRANATLNVPAGSKSAYEAADYWKEFKEIVEFIPNIEFVDANVKAICVANWDTNGDGELSEDEAAAVTNLGNVFSNNTTITSFDELKYFIGLQRIGTNSFCDCTRLTNVTIPVNVTAIGEAAFRNCYSLTSISFSDKISSIEPLAFDATGWLANQPNGLIYIGNVCYLYNGTMPENTAITLKEGTVGVAGLAFHYRSNLVSITMPSSVTNIGTCAFENCTGLKSVYFSNGLVEIGEQTFNGCSSLITIDIPNTVSAIGRRAFQGTGWLEKQPNGLIYAGRVAYGFKGSIPINLILADETVGIAGGAFSDCNILRSIMIPQNVTTIGNYAFYNCTELNTVTIKRTLPVEIHSSVFTNKLNANITLYVPLGCKAAYEAADYWKEFKEIVEIENGGSGGGEEENTDTDISSTSNVIYLNKVEARTNTQISLPIQMKNSAAIRGFQFDLYLPEGVTVVKNAKGKILASLNNGRLPEDDEHSLTLSEQTDGSIRFLCGSLYDETFTGNDGEIATLTVQIDENMADGDYPVILRNIKLTETDINNYYQTDYVKSTLTISSYMLGDINNDQQVDVSDYIGIANHILGNTPAGFNMKAADVNEDGNIDVSDYIGVANIILTGSVYGNSNAKVFNFIKEEETQEVEPE